MKFRKQDRVKITNYDCNPKMNGKYGTVVGRGLESYRVRVDGEPSTFRCLENEIAIADESEKHREILEEQIEQALKKGELCLSNNYTSDKTPARVLAELLAESLWK